MTSFACCLVVSVVIFLTTSSGVECNEDKMRYPIFPNEFRWSHTGRLNDTSYKCVQITEPSDPTWDDNFLCFKSGETYFDANVRWSYSGLIDNMRCTSIYEPSEPNNYHWKDNFLCIPKDSPYNFQWFNWRPRGYNLAKKCLRFFEPNDPHTWSDNYLCQPC